MFLDENLQKLLPMLLLQAECEKKQRGSVNGSSKRWSSVVRPQFGIRDERRLKKELEFGEGDKEFKGSFYSNRNAQKNKRIPPIPQISIRSSKRSVWPERQSTDSLHPKSLQSAYSALKDSKKHENCLLRTSVRNYVVRRLAHFFEQKHESQPKIQPSKKAINIQQGSNGSDVKISRSRKVNQDNGVPRGWHVHRKKGPELQYLES